MSVVGDEIVVEAGSRRGHVGANPEKQNRSDAKGKTSQKNPTNEAQVKAEKLPLVSVHDATAFVNALLPVVFGVIALYVVRHGIGVRLDDAGNDKEKRPKEREQTRHKANQNILSKIVAESAKHSFKR